MQKALKGIYSNILHCMTWKKVNFKISDLHIITDSSSFTFANTSGETSSSGDHNFPFFSPVDYRHSCKFKNRFNSYRKARSKNGKKSWTKLFFHIKMFYNAIITVLATYRMFPY